MFEILEKTTNGFDKIVLLDNNTATHVEIIPACGAMLHAFKVKNTSGNYINIIDSYNSREEFDNQAESKGFKGLKLSPFPCRIKEGNYQFNGNDYLFDNGKPGYSAIHGFLYNKAFKVKQKSADAREAILILHYQYDGNNTGYPFRYDCTVSYQLQAGNRLTVKTIIHNTGQGKMPVADGWHPYFGFGKMVDELQLQFQAGEVVEFENLVPTGRLLSDTTFTHPTVIGGRQLDNSFVIDFSKPGPLCVLKDPATGWQVEIQPGTNYPYLQVYIPPHRNSIAIENLSAPPDAFNNGMNLTILNSGESASFTTSYTIRGPQ